jgi:4-hydroxythreonine-4-phosphate dehydrogenase
MASVKQSNLIAITTGDLNGVGLEVTMKALRVSGSKRSKFLIFRGPDPKNPCWHALAKSRTLRVKDLGSALSELHNQKSSFRFIEVVSNDSPALWVKQATQLCLDQNLDGLVTGPVSKKTFLDAGLGSLGHTPLLKQLCKADVALMGFLGRFFNVILLSGHVPLREVESDLSPKSLRASLATVRKWQKQLPKPWCQRPLGLLGLNPHNGEGGLLGSFEKVILKKLIASESKLKGPLVPDTAFSKENWSRFSFYLAMYHDQGLIPFKMIHGHTGGAHVTIGLPIVRTSVDHGTATDIFGKGIAHPESMIDAIKWCEALIKKKG